MKLNAKQKEAVEYTGSPLLILAGAGAGKTRVLTERAVKLIKDLNLHPTELMITTFTNKAAGEMQERLSKSLGSEYKMPFAGTFHSLSAKLLRKHGHEIGVPNSFVIYDRTDQIDTVKQVLKNLNLDPKRWNPNKILNVISNAKSELLTPEAYSQFAQGQFQEKLAAIYPEYQKLLKKYKALDFDDLLLESVNLLREVERIQQRYKTQFKHVLVDEYQDTNKAQYEITKMLVNDGDLTVVGDASQSIYSWRGADYRNLMNLEQDFGNIKIINLEQNYRSTQTILDGAHSVISGNTSHPILKLWTEKDEGDKITIYEAANPEREAEFVVEKIKHLKEIWSEDFDYNDMAVFYRTNAQSRILEEELLHASIPYKIVGGTRFYDRKEIKDLLCYLRLILNPEDEVAQNRVLKVGKRRFAKYEQWKNELPEERPKTQVLLKGILKVTEYMKKFKEDDPDDAARIENIQELISVSGNFDLLSDFLENAALIETEQSMLTQGSNDEGAVTLMTLHAAKGLEFAFVFMVGMEEGIFPHSRSLLAKSEIEEERRLCYVGMTRAKEKLYMSRAASRYWFGGYQQNPPSRFLDAIPAELVEYKVDFQTAENNNRRRRRFRDEFSEDLPF